MKTACELPPDETPVLIFHHNRWRIAELRWERPSWEETYAPFRYWADLDDDGSDIEWGDVSDWLFLPPDPDPTKAAYSDVVSDGGLDPRDR